MNSSCSALPHETVGLESMFQYSNTAPAHNCKIRWDPKQYKESIFQEDTCGYWVQDVWIIGRLCLCQGLKYCQGIKNSLPLLLLLLFLINKNLRKGTLSLNHYIWKEMTSKWNKTQEVYKNKCFCSSPWKYRLTLYTWQLFPQQGSRVTGLKHEFSSGNLLLIIGDSCITLKWRNKDFFSFLPEFSIASTKCYRTVTRRVAGRTAEEFLKVSLRQEVGNLHWKLTLWLSMWLPPDLILSQSQGFQGQRKVLVLIAGMFTLQVHWDQMQRQTIKGNSFLWHWIYLGWILM